VPSIESEEGNGNDELTTEKRYKEAKCPPQCITQSNADEKMASQPEAIKRSLTLPQAPQERAQEEVFHAEKRRGADQRVI
jgi:hypothetical protein